MSTAELQALSGYQVSLCFDGVTVNLSLFVSNLLFKIIMKKQCSFSADGLWFQYGDVMMTAGESGQRGMFWLPAPGVTADCMDTSPAGNYYLL